MRHIRRTKILFHCISLESDDIVADYETIRAELRAYDPMLAEKKEVIILTKVDVVVAPERVLEGVRQIEDLHPNHAVAVFSASVLDDDSVKDLKDNLIKILRG